MQNLKRLSLFLAATTSLSALAACATAPQPAPPPALAEAPPAVPAVAAEPQIAPVSELVSEVAIPHTQFKLANGLTVIVHEDHKAPVVAVSTWYNVGSKDEPPTKTGFAHLFEHLMFNGSDNLPGDYFTYLQQIGATDYNGTTWFDRTNYFETVPKAALEKTLFMESDRMGYLLGVMDQEKLNNQRGVVQNEKRQGDNQPGGLVEYAVLGNLFPDGHPYQHSTIGSMADLDAATLATVKEWFIDNYGPNNATLVIAGDVTAAEVRPLVEKYFGGIDKGPVNIPAAADVPTLAAPKSIVMKDRVATTQIQRHWAVPGLLSPQLAALDVGGSILGGLASSRLDEILVRDEKLAVAVSAGMQPFQRVGLFEVDATVKPGVDPDLVAKRLDEIIADFIANGPTEDEVRRATTREVSGEIRGLEQVGGFGGKAVALAQGQVFAGDSDFYKKTLDAYASLTPADVKAAMQQWLTRPVLAIRLEPGERPPYEESSFTPKKGKSADIATPIVKRPVPPVGEPQPLDFPQVQHITLSNGIPVAYAQRTTVPVTQVGMVFDAGYAADVPGARGLQNFTMSMLDEGAAGMSSQEIAEAKERLGAVVAAGGDADSSDVTLSALSANLAPSLDLVADILERPTFDPTDVERVRTQLITAIAQAQKDPRSIAYREIPVLLYGETHPYGSTGLGDPAAVKSFTRANLESFRQHWLRPDNLQIFVVSDLPLADVQQQLERSFGSWTPPSAPKGVKTFSDVPERPKAEKIVLIDRPGSPQSFIMAGQVTPIDPRGEMAAISGANDILGGSFLSRINMDLREDKGWSYGVRGTAQLNAKVVPYLVIAPVQADRTADSIRALRTDIRDFLTTKGVTDEELDRTVANRIKALPGQFETSASVLSAMESNALYGRPDNYYELLAQKYEGLTKTAVDASLRSAINPDSFVWIVVGDAAKVKPQLTKLGLPVEEVQPR
jgi:predicted Zn-dependent peptidase